ncbi:MAG: 2-dehydro-3-deoxygalactonokinase [Rubrivivax sp.]
MSSTRLIALDWGSSQLRAYRLGAEGQVLEQRASDDGASRLAGGAARFEAALRALAGDWLAPGVPVLACGMVGSQHGWREAAYAACPLVLGRLQDHLAAVDGSDGLRVHIVPGVRDRAANGQPDVMRGEETQLLGLLAERPALAAGATVVLPGTHSKWVQLRQGRLEAFATRMTGELFALLREHSVLGRLMAASTGFDGAAFDRGVRAAREAGGADIARLLFSVRTLGLFDELPATGLVDYLSGLLIGTELAAGLPDSDAAAPLVLVGEAALCERYRRAFALWDREASVGTRPLAADGLWQLARQAGWC